MQVPSSPGLLGGFQDMMFIKHSAPRLAHVSGRWMAATLGARWRIRGRRRGGGE